MFFGLGRHQDLVLKIGKSKIFLHGESPDLGVLELLDGQRIFLPVFIVEITIGNRRGGG